MKYVMMLLVLAILALPVGAAEGQAKQQEQQSQGEDAQKNQEQNQGEDGEKNQEQNQGEDGEKKQEQNQGEDCEKKQEQSQGEDGEKNQEQSQGEDCEKNQEQSQGEDCEKNQEQSQGEDGEKKQEQSQGEDGEKKQEQSQGEDGEKNQEQSQGEDCEKNQEQSQGEDCEKNQEQNQGEDCEKNQEQNQGEDGEGKQQQGRGGDPARNQHRHAEQNRYREREYDCPGCQAIADLPAGEVDEDEEADLVYTREEEKLARDVYRALFNEHRKKIFRKIARSEERHMAAVLVLLTKYEIEDPVGDNPEGTFVDAGLAALYSKFVTDGMKSVEDALAVGATIEEMDIVDLTAAKENADDADLILVYEYLLRGSRNHLRAFVRQLEKRDLTYTPQYLTKEEFDAIVSTPKETARKQNREVRAINRHRKRH